MHKIKVLYGKSVYLSNQSIGKILDSIYNNFKFESVYSQQGSCRLVFTLLSKSDQFHFDDFLVFDLDYELDLLDVYEEY